MADIPDINLSQHITLYTILFTLLWEVDSKLYLSEAPDNLGKVSGSLRKRWEEGARLWLGYLFLGSLPMMLIVLVGSSSGLDLPKETLLELTLIFFHSLSLSFGVLVVKKLFPGFHTTPYILSTIVLL